VGFIPILQGFKGDFFLPLFGEMDVFCTWRMGIKPTPTLAATRGILILFKFLRPLNKMIFYYKKLYGKFDNLGVKIA
jgi:hypothetical protein